MVWRFRWPQNPPFGRIVQKRPAEYGDNGDSLPNRRCRGMIPQMDTTDRAVQAVLLAGSRTYQAHGAARSAPYGSLQRRDALAARRQAIAGHAQAVDVALEAMHEACSRAEADRIRQAILASLRGLRGEWPQRARHLTRLAMQRAIMSVRSRKSGP